MNGVPESRAEHLDEGSCVNVTLTCEPPLHLFFALLFQQGFMLRARMGSSIREVLCDQCGIENDYLDERINTVFLDGKPVDDVDTAKISEGNVLALSASLPGFAGAALRKGGYYALMRSGITHTEDSGAGSQSDGFFTVKLFNIVAEELGPRFLANGVWLESGAFEEFFRGRATSVQSRCLALEVDNRKVDAAAFVEEEWSKKYKLVMLRVISSPS